MNGPPGGFPSVRRHDAVRRRGLRLAADAVVVVIETVRIWGDGAVPKGDLTRSTDYGVDLVRAEDR
jgi:hypothetical protein